MAKIQELKEDIDEGITAGLYLGNGKPAYHVFTEGKGAGYMLVIIDSKKGQPQEKVPFADWESLLIREPNWPMESDQWELL